MSDANQDKSDKRGGFGTILNLVLKILIGLVLATTVLTNLFLVYIVVAPDTLPKPFYLQYKNEASADSNSAPVAAEGSEGSAGTDPAVATAEVHTIVAGEGIFIDTGTKIVNLADQGGRKFIRVNVVVEFAPTSTEYLTMAEELKTEYLNTFTSEINTKLPVINDIIITQISTKDFAAIYTADGKELLRSELIAILNEKLSEYTVLNVYFTEFVMQ